MEVGIRELRNNLSRYLDQVEGGQELLVTDRGRAVARLIPVAGKQTLDRLIAEGLVTPASRPKRARPAPIKTKGTVSDLIADQRR